MYLIKIKRSPFYQIAYKNEFGKITTISTGTKNKSEALKFLSELKIKNNYKSDDIKVLLSDFAVEYLNLIKPKLSAKYVKAVEICFKQFESFIGNIYLCNVELRKAEGFIFDVYASSKFMAASNYRILKSAFSKAQEWKYISDNPFKKFKLPKLPQSLPVFINQDQLMLILSKTKSKVMKNIFATAFYTGLRRNEILNLRWSMINFESKILTLRQDESFTTKNKRERIIPINETLLEILVDIFLKQKNKTLDSYVFSIGKSFPIDGDWVSKSFKRAVRAANLSDDIHFHTLRHSFASSLIQSGVSIYIVKELLGHRDISTTQIYSHIQTKNLVDAVKKLDPVKPKTDNSLENKNNKTPFVKFDICLN